MNNFETTLVKFVEESESLQKRELALNQENRLFGEKLAGFLKEHGLPENFTVPQLAILAVRKSRELIKV